MFRGLTEIQQCDEHLRLHPNTTFERTLIQEPGQETVRESATQTDPKQDYEEPKPKSNDSLNDKPGEHSIRLCCDKCYHVMNDLNEMASS